MAKYTAILENGKYVIYNGKSILRTPAGKPVTTEYKELADKLLKDLKKYGMAYTISENILSWHFSYVENMADMDHKQLEEMLLDNFMSAADWTFFVGSNAKFVELAGAGQMFDRKYDIEKWLERCTKMQITAACCIANAYEALNLSYMLALIIEKIPKEDREKELKKFAKVAAECYPYASASDMMLDFMNFNLYYGIHLDENGPITKAACDYDDDDE